METVRLKVLQVIRNEIHVSGCCVFYLNWLIRFYINVDIIVEKFLPPTWLRYVRVFPVANPSVVCNICAPYSAGCNFRQCFYAIFHLNHPLTSVQNFTEIVPGTPIHRGLYARGVAKYGNVRPVEGYLGNAAKYTGPQFGETIYMCEVNEATKVKSDAQIAINKNSYLVQKFVPQRMAGVDNAPNWNFFKLLELSETSRARKHIFGLHINIDKANSRRYHVTHSS